MKILAKWHKEIKAIIKLTKNLKKILKIYIELIVNYKHN